MRLSDPSDRRVLILSSEQLSWTKEETFNPSCMCQSPLCITISLIITISTYLFLFNFQYLLTNNGSVQRFCISKLCILWYPDTKMFNKYFFQVTNDYTPSVWCYDVRQGDLNIKTEFGWYKFQGPREKNWEIRMHSRFRNKRQIFLP